MKTIPLAIALLFSSVAFAQTKTIDFYSSSGSSRYSTQGTIKSLNLPIKDNTVLLSDVNNDAYVTLNNNYPIFSRLIRNNLSAYQMLNEFKGENVSYKDKTVKILGNSGDKVIVEDNNVVRFVPIEDIQIPKSFFNNSQNGLKVTFNQNIKDSDNIYFSQIEPKLRFSNSYDSVINGNDIKVVHFLNITNSSLKTFDNVFLNFFFSPMNIQESMNLPVAMAAPMMNMAKSARADVSAPPQFENSNLNDLKMISIDKPITIYPNINKIKFSENTYPVKQFAKLNIEKKHQIFHVFNDNPKDFSKDDLATMDKEVEVSYKNFVESFNKQDFTIQNIIEITPSKDKVLPSGSFSVYEKSNNQDKLIISTPIQHTENKSLELFKGNNQDLKIKNIKFKLDKQNNVSHKFYAAYADIESLDVENLGKKAFELKINDKLIKILPGKTETIKINK